MVIVFLLVEVAPATHELVRRGARCYGWRWRTRTVEAVLENALDVSAMRHPAAGDGKDSMTSRIHALGTVLFCAAQDAEDGAVAHLWIGVTVEGAAHDLFDVRPELGAPGEHTLGRPAAVVLVDMTEDMKPRLDLLDPVEQGGRADVDPLEVG